MHRMLLLAGTIAGVALTACPETMAQQTAPAPAPPAAPSPPLPYGMPISLALAKRAATAAEAEAKKSGFPSAIVIVGPNGETIYSEKMDGSNNSAVMAAEQKAKGAALPAPEQILRGSRAAGALRHSARRHLRHRRRHPAGFRGPHRWRDWRLGRAELDARCGSGASRRRCRKI